MYFPPQVTLSLNFCIFNILVLKYFLYFIKDHYRISPIIEVFAVDLFSTESGLTWQYNSVNLNT